MMETVFKSTDKLSFVIQNDYRLLQVMGRFGMTIGFGEKTIFDVCQQCNVDVNAFLAVMNYVKNNTIDSIGSISSKEGVASLLKYLKNSHRYFLDYQFPSMRRSLIDSIEMQNEIAFLVLKYYDIYVEEVRLHMANEDDTTFAWVEQMLNDDSTLSESGQLLSRHHDSIEKKLGELKKLFLQYYPQKDNNNELNSVVIELYRTEEELRSHCLIEDNLFTPAVRKLENRQKQNRVKLSEEQNENNEMPKTDLLSEREKEIVACVAKGLSNKEIAEYLFLSINTVTTHRRNIAKKLSIHSSAGITIYAIVNHLVKIEDVSL